ncbi:MAG: hypothetical protein C4294_01970 [Nitrospiraceae bacterium]
MPRAADRFTGFSGGTAWRRFGRDNNFGCQTRTNGYTGHLLPPFPYGEGKRRLVESFAHQQQIDLKHCYAYGDSPGDLEVLQSVGYPLVVNPIRGMARIARRRGWPVARWA